MGVSGITGVILAGGRNSRFGGRNKAFAQVAGRPLIHYIYETFQKLFSEIVIVAATPVDYLPLDALIVTDIYELRSSLTGIHAGLYSAGHERAFIAACDSPFIRPELAAFLCELATPDMDVVVPETAAGLEPLCAVYHRRCLERIAHRLEAGRPRIREFFNRARVRRVSEKRLRELDPDLISFININTPEDLEAAETMLSERKEREEQ